MRCECYANKMQALYFEADPVDLFLWKLCRYLPAFYQTGRNTEADGDGENFEGGTLLSEGLSNEEVALRMKTKS